MTSVLEGALNTVAGVSNIRACHGREADIFQWISRGTDMETTQFDVSTRLRQTRQSAGRSMGIGERLGWRRRTAARHISLIYDKCRYAGLGDSALCRGASGHALSRIDGVDGGWRHRGFAVQWVITFDPNSLRRRAESGSLSNALGRYFQNSIVGTQIIDDRMMLVRHKTPDLSGELELNPISKINGRLYNIGDFATITYQEQTPQSYNRINGLNTISLDVNAMEGINTIMVTDAVTENG